MLRIEGGAARNELITEPRGQLVTSSPWQIESLSLELEARIP